MLCRFYICILMPVYELLGYSTSIMHEQIKVPNITCCDYNPLDIVDHELMQIHMDHFD